MYKATIELGRINKNLKLKFGLIIESEADKQNYNKLVHKFNYMGNDYLRINPRPFIIIDISSSSDKENINKDQFVTLNKISLYSFIKALGKLISQFREIKDLFYYTNKKLMVNNMHAQNITKTVATNSKYIRLQPCVVPSDDVENKFYEGCVLCINSYENFCYITYSEMEFLYYELSHINMTQLSLELINTVSLFKNSEKEELKPKNIIKEDTEIIIDSNQYVKIEEPKNIPDI